MEVLLQQEYAAVKKFIIDCLDDIYPYFENIPENFIVPSIFFPAVEITSLKETLNTFGFSAFADVVLYDKSTNDASFKAQKVVYNINLKHCKIPIYTKDGEETPEIVRVDLPEVSKIDEGVYQIHISWDSKISFDDIVNKPKAEKVNFDYNFI